MIYLLENVLRFRAQRDANVSSWFFKMDVISIIVVGFKILENIGGFVHRHVILRVNEVWDLIFATHN